jgi:uncharacterized 2Fe-2S/4Fe-4S cluster protein (DUF4445 family)
MEITIEGSPGERLLDKERGSGGGDYHSAPCGGRGRCGKCRVRVLEGEGLLVPPSPGEESFLSPEELAGGWRLSCLATFAGAGPLRLELPGESIRVPLESLSPGFRPRPPGGALEVERPLRLAVDLGTTTIVGHLIDPWRGLSYGSAAQGNRQRAWGSDVVSRIEAAKEPAALASLRDSAISQIGSILEELCARSGLASSSVGEVAVAGNTVMLHLLLGCDPSGLGRLPFTPVFLEERRVDAAAAGLPLPPGSVLALMPGISSFVGADLTAGILATRLFEAREPELLIDIGTNGEIVLSSPGGMYCTATAAGPAFEGAQIECGSPSVPGAIDHAGWDEGGFWFSTIEGEAPVGVCGSGLLDILAALRLRGLMDETGRLDLEEDERGIPRFHLDSERGISVSQNDVRQIQLAKGAIAAGIRVLCLKAGVALAEVARVHLAGGFGSFLDPRSALAIGLLPAEFRGKIVAAGNTSLKGVLEVACGDGALRTCRDFIPGITALDLSAEGAFQDEFMEAMLFPDDEALGRFAAG